MKHCAKCNRLSRLGKKCRFCGGVLADFDVGSLDGAKLVAHVPDHPYKSPSWGEVRMGDAAPQKRTDVAPGVVTFQVSPLQPVLDTRDSIDALALLELRGPMRAGACSRARVFATEPINPLVLLFHIAFLEHRPLVLRPDDIWLAIAKGISLHVRRHAEELRPRLVRHEGKRAISVRRDDLLVSPAGWPSVVTELVAKVREHIGGRADLFRCNFTTTGVFEQMASEVVLLDTMQAYFEYSVKTFSGIPAIRLEGTVEDWADIRRRVRAIEELAVDVRGALDVQKWASALDLVLEQLEHSASGVVDRAFWLNAYSWSSQSGGDRVTGWIHAFFPFLTKDRSNPYALKPLSEPGRFGGASPDEFPDGAGVAPFTWERLDEKLLMDFWAGPLGVSQDEDGWLRIAYAWAIRDRSAGHASELPFKQTIVDCRRSLQASPKARSLDGIEAFGDAYAIDLSGCGELQSVEALRGRKDVVQLLLKECTSLTDIEVIGTLENLEELSLIDATNITDIRFVAKLPKLRDLMVWGNANVLKELWQHYGSRAAVEELQAKLR